MKLEAQVVVALVGDLPVEIHVAPSEAAVAVLDRLCRSWPLTALQPVMRLAVGGDGCVLRCLQAGVEDGLVCYGVSAGHVGFLANAAPDDFADLPDRIAAADVVELRPLHIRGTTVTGEEVAARALNELSVGRRSPQAVSLSVVIDGVTRLEHLAGDGMIVATPLGSTAYSRSAGGPVLPLDAPLIALTPLAPYRPRFGAAVFPDSTEIVIEIHDPENRPALVCADQLDLGHLRSLRVHRDRGRRALLACDKNDHLAERIIASAFAG